MLCRFPQRGFCLPRSLLNFQCKRNLISFFPDPSETSQAVALEKCVDIVTGIWHITAIVLALSENSSLTSKLQCNKGVRSKGCLLGLVMAYEVLCCCVKLTNLNQALRGRDGTLAHSQEKSKQTKTEKALALLLKPLQTLLPGDISIQPQAREGPGQNLHRELPCVSEGCPG